MNIAMIGWEYPPFKAGGLATHCYGLTRSLTDKRVNVDFYMPKTKKSASTGKKNLRIIEVGETEIFPYDIDDVWNFWEDLGFVDFIILGKWNYDKRAKTEKARKEYAKIVPLFEEFCHEYGIHYHIKSDTRKFIQPSLPKVKTE